MGADGNYTEVYFANGQKLLLTKTLKNFSTILKEAGILLAHQSHLFHFEHIREFIKTDGGYIVMTDGSKVPTAVCKRADVVDRLGG